VLLHHFVINKIEKLNFEKLNFIISWLIHHVWKKTTWNEQTSDFDLQGSYVPACSLALELTELSLCFLIACRGPVAPSLHGISGPDFRAVTGLGYCRSMQILLSQRRSGLHPFACAMTRYSTKLIPSEA
jgi:hypothetical protein